MAKRDYATGELTVHWDSTRCIHTAVCLRALPSVFDVRRRPWIQIDAASADEIVAAVRRCPTGALRYTLADGTVEPAPERTTMVPLPGGPLIVRGDVRLTQPDGTVLEETRLALCRCGRSRNQPFCDNSHRASARASTDFAEAPRSTAEHEAAEAPDEVCPPQRFNLS